MVERTPPLGEMPAQPDYPEPSPLYKISKEIEEIKALRDEAYRLLGELRKGPT